jgi:hypothetical protein
VNRTEKLVTDEERSELLEEPVCPQCGAKYYEHHKEGCRHYVPPHLRPENFKNMGPGRIVYEPKQSGVKYDSAKHRPALVIDGFASALDEIALVATFGANKYTDDGWVDVPDGVKRYKDAMYRHLMAEAKGQAVDSESGLLHLAHAAWNILAVLELKLRGE